MCQKWDFRHKRWNRKQLFNHTYWQAQIESLGQNHIELNIDSFWALQKVYLKSYFLFHLFSHFFFKWLKSAIFYKTSSGGEKRRYYQKIKQIYHWQDTCGNKYYLLFLSKFVSMCCFDLLKKKYISNFNEISL